MSELYFSYGRGESFTSIRLADQKNGYANPIRELMQNSLTASREAKNKKCEINIYIETIKKSDIPNIRDYEDALDKSVKFLKSIGGYTEGNQSIVSNIKNYLKQDSIGVLMFVDNGTGMNKKKLENLLDEISSHADDSAGGSYGVGHISSYFLSSIRYVLYATKFEENNEIKSLFTGSTILAGHRSDGKSRGNKGRIIENKPVTPEDPDFNYPEKFPNFIQEKMDGINTGSMVVVLGLNEKWNDDAEYAIASNFFHAISHDSLSITVHQNNKITSFFNDEKVKQLLYSRCENQRAKEDAILSGQDTYWAYQAVMESQKIAQLSNQDKVYLYPKETKANSCLCLIRNGMLIARHDNMLSIDINNLKKNDDFEPFVVVIEVDKDDAKQLFRLVRNAENPYHNKLKSKKETNKKDKKEIKKLFKELSERIKECLVKKDRDGFDLAMPLLEFPSQAEAQGSNTFRPRSQTLKANPSQSKPKSPKRNPDPDLEKICSRCHQVPCICPKSPPRPKPIVISRILESKNAVRFKDNGSTLDVIMRIEPQAMDTKDEVYFSMSLAVDTDNDSVDSALDLINLSINSVDIPIPDFVDIKVGEEIKQEPADKSRIKLGKLEEGQLYTIRATIEKPDKVKNLGVALKPFLGLKQRKGGI